MIDHKIAFLKAQSEGLTAGVRSKECLNFFQTLLVRKDFK